MPLARNVMNYVNFRNALAVSLIAIFAAGCQWPMRDMEGDGVVSVPLEPIREPTADQQMVIDQANAARDSGDYDQAIDLFRSILEENPMITNAYLGIGDIYMLEENYDAAEPVYARAATLEPRNFDAQYGHGLALQMLGRFIDAVKAYHKALTIDPNSPKANLNLATTYLHMEESYNALSFAEKAVELSPNDGAARVNLGTIYANVERNEDAIDQYIQALELLDNNTAPVMLNLINVLAKEHRYREAANTAENLVKINPSAEAYERLGWAYFRLGEYDDSLAAYRDAVEEDPKYWPALNGIGINALNSWLLSKKTDSQSRIEARDAFRRSLLSNRSQPKLITLMSNYNLM